MRTLVLLLALAACSPAPAPTSAGDAGLPANPTGTVGGLVLDVDGEMPLAGVGVTVISGGATFTGPANDKGLYSISGVPAGPFTLTAQLADYETAMTQGELVGSQ